MPFGKFEFQTRIVVISANECKMRSEVEHTGLVDHQIDHAAVRHLNFLCALSGGKAFADAEVSTSKTGGQCCATSRFVTSKVCFKNVFNHCVFVSILDRDVPDIGYPVSGGYYPVKRKLSSNFQFLHYDSQSKYTDLNS